MGSCRGLRHGDSSAYGGHSDGRVTCIEQASAPTYTLLGLLQGCIAKRECLVQLIEVAALLPPSAALQLIRAVRTLTADPPLLLPLYVSCRHNTLAPTLTSRILLPVWPNCLLANAQHVIQCY